MPAQWQNHCSRLDFQIALCWGPMCRHGLTVLTTEEPWKVSSVYKYVLGSMASNSRIFPLMKSSVWCFLLRRLQITLSKTSLLSQMVSDLYEACGRWFCRGDDHKTGASCKQRKHNLSFYKYRPLIYRGSSDTLAIGAGAHHPTTV